MGVSVLLSRGLVGTTDVTVRAGEVGTVGSSPLSEVAGRGRAGWDPGALRRIGRWVKTVEL